MKGYSCDRQCEEMIDMRMSDYWPMMGLTIFNYSSEYCFQDMTANNDGGYNYVLDIAL